MHTRRARTRVSRAASALSRILLLRRQLRDLRMHRAVMHRYHADQKRGEDPARQMDRTLSVPVGDQGVERLDVPMRERRTGGPEPPRPETQHPPPDRGRQPGNLGEWLEKSHADVLIEASPLNVLNGQPAIEHLKGALGFGAHALTANKGPIVYGFEELTKLAADKKKKFLYESTVMDGVPIFSMFPLGLPAVDLRGFHGVLNSTTNVVLTEIERGLSFDEAVKRAQAMGIVTDIGLFLEHLAQELT